MWISLDGHLEVDGLTGAAPLADALQQRAFLFHDAVNQSQRVVVRLLAPIAIDDAVIATCIYKLLKGNDIRFQDKEICAIMWAIHIKNCIETLTVLL